MGNIYLNLISVTVSIRSCTCMLYVCICVMFVAISDAVDGNGQIHCLSILPIKIKLN
jgi:hypothetical protein